MILDLHTHTKEHSACSQQSAEDLISQAAEIGLDGLVITDHDYLWTAADLDDVCGRVGRSIVVLRGQEVSCPDGHLLVYGVEAPVPRELARRDLAAWVREQGGATILAHPFRWNGFAEASDEDIVNTFRSFEAVEAWTTNHSDPEIERVLKFRGQDGVRLVGASDAHSIERVGRFATSFDGKIASERDLVCLLRQGAFHAVKLAGKTAYQPCR